MSFCGGAGSQGWRPWTPDESRAMNGRACRDPLSVLRVCPKGSLIVATSTALFMTQITSLPLGSRLHWRGVGWTTSRCKVAFIQGCGTISNGQCWACGCPSGQKLPVVWHHALRLATRKGAGGEQRRSGAFLPKAPAYTDSQSESES